MNDYEPVSIISLHNFCRFLNNAIGINWFTRLHCLFFRGVCVFWKRKNV